MSSLYTLQEELANRAFSVISSGIDRDGKRDESAPLTQQKDEIAAVMRCYLNGVDMLDRALKEKDPNSERSRCLTGKLERNRKMVIERIEKLQEEYASIKAQIEIENAKPSSSPSSSSIGQDSKPARDVQRPSTPPPKPAPPKQQQHPPVRKVEAKVIAVSGDDDDLEEEKEGSFFSFFSQAFGVGDRKKKKSSSRIEIKPQPECLADQLMRSSSSSSQLSRSLPSQPQTKKVSPSVQPSRSNHPKPSLSVPPAKPPKPQNPPVTTSPPSSQPSQQPHKGNPEILRGIDKKLQSAILDEVVENGPSVSWDDIGGLEDVKSSLYEAIILPSLRPELFSGLRSPPKGMLLFGPPGNGKTMIAKAVAHESKATFFNISASSLTSKWVGEGEKMVKALFALARYLQPSVIFIDEVDSILTERSSGENDAMRRLKTEFLIQFDGVGSADGERIFVLGATNRPQDLDEAARRRFAKRVYVRLPDAETRKGIVVKLLAKNANKITGGQLNKIANLTEGYSAADLTNLCKDAAMAPLRDIDIRKVATVSVDKVRPIVFSDFEAALTQIRPSVSQESLEYFEKWNSQFGCK